LPPELRLEPDEHIELLQPARARLLAEVLGLRLEERVQGRLETAEHVLAEVEPLAACGTKDGICVQRADDIIAVHVLALGIRAVKRRQRFPLLLQELLSRLADALRAREAIASAAPEHRFDERGHRLDRFVLLHAQARGDLDLFGVQRCGLLLWLVQFSSPFLRARRP